MVPPSMQLSRQRLDSVSPSSSTGSFRATDVRCSETGLHIQRTPITIFGAHALQWLHPKHRSPLAGFGGTFAGPGGSSMVLPSDQSSCSPDRHAEPLALVFWSWLPLQWLWHSLALAHKPQPSLNSGHQQQPTFEFSCPGAWSILEWRRVRGSRVSFSTWS